MSANQKKKWTRLITYTTLAALAVAFGWLNWFSPFLLVNIRGNSMIPTFQNGSWHFANKRSAKLQRGDVIVFNIKNETYIKRIVALPGDEIPVYYGIDDGQIYAAIEEMGPVMLGLSHEWITIPLDYMWVEGDSPNHTSVGSGHIGLVNVKDIIGVMNYTEPPKSFWYLSVVNQKEQPPPSKFKHKHA